MNTRTPLRLILTLLLTLAGPSFTGLAWKIERYTLIDTDTVEYDIGFLKAQAYPLPTLLDNRSCAVRSSESLRQA